MNDHELRTLLDQVRAGALEPAAAAERIGDALRAAPFEDLGFARLDTHREVRQGFPEVVLGLGKTPEQVGVIAEQIAARGQSLLVTRADVAAWEAVRARLPEAEYHSTGRTITLMRKPPTLGHGIILIVSAGTSDAPVAEEAAITATMMGNTVDRLFDVGVAGIHRVLAERERLQRARLVIVVAGMEGALPSVIAGLVRVPVIAVPTSIGYGASFGGIAPLLGMLNSCANGVAVVNIDNGYGAACVASLMNHV